MPHPIAEVRVAPLERAAELRDQLRALEASELALREALPAGD